jgi:hypothetical protein
MAQTQSRCLRLPPRFVLVFKFASFRLPSRAVLLLLLHRTHSIPRPPILCIKVRAPFLPPLHYSMPSPQNVKSHPPTHTVLPSGIHRTTDKTLWSWQRAPARHIDRSIEYKKENGTPTYIPMNCPRPSSWGGSKEVQIKRTQRHGGTYNDRQNTRPRGRQPPRRTLLLKT